MTSFWAKNWKIKLNEVKSIHINFTEKRTGDPPPGFINGIKVLYENNAKYLGMTLDAKLYWKEHLKKNKIRAGTKIQTLLASG